MGLSRQRPVSSLLDQVSTPRPELPVGGRLQHFVREWEQITSDPFILNMVRGMSLDLTEFPRQTTLPHEIKMSQEETQAAETNIDQLLEKGAIKPWNYTGTGYVSNIFLRPKPDGSFRMILNLKGFNKYIEYAHFKMESLNNILDLVLPNAYMCVLDLTDAYLTVAVGPYFVRFLVFRFNGKFYCYVCIPFGLSSAPRKFTKLLKPVISFLRRQGITCIIYIDDLWLMALTYSACLRSMFNAANLLSKVGFLLNKKKSHPVPSQEVVALGYIVNSVSMTVSLPQHKTEDVIHHCTELLHSHKPSIRYIARVLGKMIACFPVLPVGRAHYRFLE